MRVVATCRMLAMTTASPHECNRVWTSPRHLGRSPPWTGGLSMKMAGLLSSRLPNDRSEVPTQTGEPQGQFGDADQEVQYNDIHDEKRYNLSRDFPDRDLRDTGCSE